MTGRRPCGILIYGMNVHSEIAQRRGRGRPIVDDKRRRILDAALAAFAARGYHGTAVPDVARAAGVGTGSLYRYFASKEALVNEVYRDAKQRLKSTLLDELAAPADAAGAEAWFAEVWRRLATFARAEPEAFRFLELQDHVAYLDAESRALELSVLGPLWLTGHELLDARRLPVDAAIAMLWGAFVGLVKASRLGYLALDDRKLAQAGAAAWQLVAASARTPTSRTRTARTRTFGTRKG